MSNEQHQGEPVKTEDAKDETPQPQNISIQDILNTYPIDREKCRDVILVELSRSMLRIADSVEAMSQGLVVVNTHLSALVKKQSE